ncbi:MAG: hypothetical protein QGF09_17175 [Rhodospirillales bacterium]|nr:hypothetical protein [Rhodospirillales bacterium]
MTGRAGLLVVVALILGACADYEKGDVVRSSSHEIRIKIGYDAANQGFDTDRQAAEHCEDSDRKAKWMGHDKDGNLLYRCQ